MKALVLVLGTVVFGAILVLAVVVREHGPLHAEATRPSSLGRPMRFAATSARARWIGEPVEVNSAAPPPAGLPASTQILPTMPAELPAPDWPMRSRAE